MNKITFPPVTGRVTYRVRGRVTYRVRKFSAVAVLLALAVTGAGVISAAPASATAPASLPDAGQDMHGELIVHKYAQPVTQPGLPANGTQLGASALSGLTPLAGVTFSVQLVGSGIGSAVDLTTNAGWATVQGLGALPVSNDAAQAWITGIHALSLSDGTGTAVAGNAAWNGSAASGSVAQVITNAAGVADFTGLPLGLYLVTETGTPAGVVAGAPFLVTVPLTQPDSRDSWMYTVNAYPKNQVLNASMSVDDASAVLAGNTASDTVTWTVSAPLPVLASGQQLGGYTVTDQLDPRLTVNSSAVGVSVNGTALTPGSGFVASQAGGVLMVTLGDLGGLTQYSGQNLSITIPSTVTANTGDGVIGNQAHVSFYLAGSSSAVTNLDTGVTATKWADVKAAVQDENGAALTGSDAVAQFALYDTDPSANSSAAVLASVSTDPVTGIADFGSVRYSDFVDGSGLTSGDALYRTYYIMQTKAPAGHELAAKAFAVVVGDATAGQSYDVNGVAQVASPAVMVVVKDAQSNAGFALPFTGGHGTGLIVAVGSVLLALVAALVLAVAWVRRRKALNQELLNGPVLNGPALNGTAYAGRHGVAAPGQSS